MSRPMRYILYAMTALNALCVAILLDTFRHSTANDRLIP
jgi:hypothetical protein